MSNLWRPESFQGRGKNKNYFEGWYYKSVTQDEKTAISVISGLSLSKVKTESHAFIMVVDARNQKLYYFRYSTDEFHADKKKFELIIGKSFFHPTK